MALRTLAPIIGFICQMTSLKYISVGTFTVIFSTNPFITTIFASIIHGTKISRIEIMAMVISFIGVIVVVSDKSNEETQSSGATTLYATLTGLALAFAPTLAFCANGLLAYSLRPLHFTVQLFYLALASVLFASFCGLGQLLVQGRTLFLQLNLNQFQLLLGLGCSDLGVFMFSTLGFTYGGPSVALFGFAGIVWAFIADVYVFDQTVSIQQLVPVACIAIVAIVVGYLKSNNRI